MSTKCPKCGSAFSHTACDGRNVVYECGRVGRTAGGPTDSIECLRRQLAQSNEKLDRWGREIREGVKLLDRYKDDLGDANARADRAEAVVEKLPKTADGVVIIHPMRLWFNSGDSESPAWIDMDRCIRDGSKNQWVVWGEAQITNIDSVYALSCYSTQAAAAHAKDKQ